MLFDRLTARRPSRSRRDARARRPAVEAMEARQLLATYMLVDAAKAVEGTGGTRTMEFTVKITSSAVPVSVHYNTADRSALAGSDYVATAGTLTFAPGEVSKKIPVTILSGSAIELNEVFDMKLSSPTNATIVSSLALGTILDDDTPVDPELAVNNVTMTRGLNGSRTMVFTVSLNTALSTTVSVKVSTRNGTALAGADYAARSGVLTFAPGETSKRFAVTIYGTSTWTKDKFFYVGLSEAGVSIGDATGYGMLKYGA